MLAVARRRRRSRITRFRLNDQTIIAGLGNGVEGIPFLYVARVSDTLLLLGVPIRSAAVAAMRTVVSPYIINRSWRERRQQGIGVSFKEDWRRIKRVG